MTQAATDIATKKKSLPIAGRVDLDVDSELARFEAEERARLGLAEEKQWLEDMANLMFTKREKGKITLLIGGLTMAHDYLVSGGFRSLGYTVVPLDCPDTDALRVGKEFGNRGQCNPTYFTVGNLVKFLIYLRDEKSIPTAEIIDKFVFLTAGACGPCRFGMYTTEYRKALRDAGFDGFKVMLFQQQGGLSQATGEESGLDLSPAFFIALLKGLVAGDVINAQAYRLRPYEVVPGATDRAVAEAKRICYEALLEKKSILLALRRVKKVFEAVEVDRTLGKPRVAIIGEFWAMTTEGDGNYALQRFLEQEGAECDIQLVTAWILYNIWEVRFDTKSRALLRGFDGGKYGLAGIGEHGVLTRKVGLYLADKALRAAFQTFAHAGGFYGYHLPDMDQIADIAAPHYNNDLRGGEGHMEVGKLILNVAKSKATMTLSVKPFGCMPSSSVSDGVQSLITEKFPGTIYCAVETSGDGAVNFYSRVQMYLFKARQAAQAEIDEALRKTGLTLDEVRAFVKENPRLGSALHKPPHAGGCTTTDLIAEVGALYGKSPTERALVRVKSAAAAAKELLTEAARVAPEKLPAALALVKQGASELREIAEEKGPEIARSAARAARNRLSRVVPPGKPQAPEYSPVAAE